MLLVHVSIENFRGIRRLELELDPTTGLFGEGSFGKTSLLDALEFALGLSAQLPVFEPGDLHRWQGACAQEVGLRLRLQEQEPGQWSRSPFREVGLDEAQGSPRQCSLVARGRLGSPECVETEWFVEGLEATSPEQVRALRRLLPVLVLRPHRREAQLSPVAPSQTSQSNPLEAQVAEAYRQIRWSGGVPTQTDFESGLAAALALANRYAHLLHERGTPSRDWLREVVEAPRALGGADLQLRPGVPPGRMQQTAALLLCFGALLEARAQDIQAGSQPLLVVENIETNLHPITLAAFLDLVLRLPGSKLLLTNCPEVLAGLPLHSLRRTVRRESGLEVFRVRREALSPEDKRKIGYHLRVNRADSVLARCWLLVEGESEFWLLPELARILGYDFPSEGIRCVEFAQCGVRPILKLAGELGIEWVLMADGDRSGQGYVDTARQFLSGHGATEHLTLLPERDVENYLFKTGFAGVYREAAAMGRGSAQRIVARALARYSKPHMILTVLEEVRRRGRASVPPVLANLIENAVHLARRAGM